MIKTVDGANVLLLKHVGGTQETMPIETILPHSVSIRWRQSGIYDLNLANNILIARSTKARIKGKGQAHWWSALDIEQVRHWVWEHFNPVADLTERERMYQKHVANMPYLNR